MKLSKKKESELYEVIHEEIIQARIKIVSVLKNDPDNLEKIDSILFDLNIIAPKKAIDLFRK